MSSGLSGQFLAWALLLETSNSGALLWSEEGNLNHTGQALGERALASWNLSQKKLAREGDLVTSWPLGHLLLMG